MIELTIIHQRIQKTKHMKFFIPHAKDKTQEANVYDATKKFAKKTTEWDIEDDKIFSVRYVHNGKNYYSEVGKVETYEGEEVIAILKSNTYLICTPNRGVIRGMPILVGFNEAIEVIHFDKEEV